jgi:cell division protein FtsW
VLVEPDLGTALTLMLVVGAILLVSGTRLPLLAPAYGLGLGLPRSAAWSSPYRPRRLLTFLDPWKDPTGAGFRTCRR